MSERTITLRADLVERLESLAGGRTLNDVVGDLLAEHTPLAAPGKNWALALLEGVFARLRAEQQLRREVEQRKERGVEAAASPSCRRRACAEVPSGSSGPEASMSPPTRPWCHCSRGAPASGEARRSYRMV